MPKNTEIWNLAEVTEKHRLMRQISALPPGLYDVLIKPHRWKRSLDQNAYYWVAVVAPFKEWLVENWGESVTAEQAHDTLKLALLERPELDGIVLMPSSKDLTIEEFSEYLEN